VVISSENEGKKKKEAVDEIKLYVLGRHLCAMEAVWRIFEYQTYAPSEPSVNTVKVKTKEVVDALLDKKKASDMFVYMNRPEQLVDMKMTDLFKDYNYGYTAPARGILDQDYYTIVSTSIGKPIYITPISSNHARLCRLEMIYVTAGEPYYLRLIIKNRAVTSWTDAKTFEGKVYDTYQQSALAWGFVKEHEEAVKCFEDIALNTLGRFGDIHMTPANLRGLFCHLTVEGFCTLPIYEREDLLNTMLEDFLQKDSNRTLAINSWKQDVYDRLQKADKTMEEYGLVPPQQTTTELDKEKLRYDCEQQRLLYETLCREEPNNAQQQVFFDAVIEAVLNPTTPTKDRRISLTGIAGSGKTAVAKKICAYLRSKGKIVLICTATTLASQNYGNNAYTAHSLFKYPVIDPQERDFEEHITCR
jgi:hypothetical protein